MKFDNYQPDFLGNYCTDIVLQSYFFNDELIDEVNCIFFLVDSTWYQLAVAYDAEPQIYWSQNKPNEEHETCFKVEQDDAKYCTTTIFNKMDEARLKVINLEHNLFNYQPKVTLTFENQIKLVISSCEATNTTYEIIE